MCIACKSLIKAIDGYIEKANDDLVDKLKKAGFINPEDTVKTVEELEEKLYKALVDQKKLYTKELKKADSISDFLGETFDKLKLKDTTEVVLLKHFIATLDKKLEQYTDAYLKSIDKEMELIKVTDKTNYYIHRNAEWLSEKMKLNGQTKLEQILNKAADDGSSVKQVTKQILDEGIRGERYQARRVALTEMLRAHSYAADDAMMQSSVVEDKEWVHTGAKNSVPRENHLAMSGVRVHKEEPFELFGLDGGVYYPMHPHDVCLPASESVNCHCICQAVISKDALGIDVDERRRMQKEYLESMDRAWEKELDEEMHQRAIEWRQERGLNYAPL